MSTPSAEIVSTPIKIDRIISRIEEGDIKIPAFQRGFVWDQEQIIELLDSLYRNFPIGSILLWNSAEHLKASRNVAGFQLPDRDATYPVNYTLDGQQRLSTIYAVFCVDRTPAQTSGQYMVDLNIFDISFDFEKEMFIPTEDVDSSQATMKLHSLFDTEAFFEVLEGLSPEHRRAARNLHSRFNNYEVPVVTISRRSKSEVGIIFERINSTGTTLGVLDLMVAWTWSEDFHLQEEISDLLETLATKGFGDLPERVILQSISGILCDSTKTATMLEIEASAVRNIYDTMEESMVRAVDFLSTELKVSSRELLPHVQQVVALTWLFWKVKSPTAQQVKVLKQWFWKTAFSRRYSAQTDDKMDADIRFMKSVADGSISTTESYSYTIDAGTLTKQKMIKSNPYARACLLLLAQKTPLDLINGTKIDLGEALSQFNRKEYHHIFPRAFLRGNGYDTDEINSLCNFCFLPAGSNKIISNKAPSDYFNSLVPSDRLGEILESNVMPLHMEVYSEDDYEQFLQRRGDLILQFLDSLLV